MNIRQYCATDRQACIDIFNSNCPKYFDPSEIEYLYKWLDFQDTGVKVKGYKDALADDFFVLETEGDVIGCGGYYLTPDGSEAVMAWGMVLNNMHKKGYGKVLYEYRARVLKEKFPDARITLHTSQHTFGFFEKMGHQVKTVTKDGYGDGLDRYDME